MVPNSFRPTRKKGTRYLLHHLAHTALNTPQIPPIQTFQGVKSQGANRSAAYCREEVTCRFNRDLGVTYPLHSLLIYFLVLECSSHLFSIAENLTSIHALIWSWCSTMCYQMSLLTILWFSGRPCRQVLHIQRVRYDDFISIHHVTARVERNALDKSSTLDSS